jgi:hypothetical protein
MSSKHHDSKKDTDTKQGAACHFCKEKFAYPEKPTPSGICNKCQTKIAVIILIIFVVLGGMVFFGIL